MTDTPIVPADRAHGFTVERVEPIPELRCEATILSHDKSGARLIHLLNDNPNNLFCIAFRTPVHDNTGVAHILEHSVLGGSRRFPVKDPFQILLKSSLQTFLNALTYPDRTLYPVSSQVEKDFYNLVDVYCDAVFNPLLTENTFHQEGWHFDVPDPRGPVGIKGIVYNEMKGVFSDYASHVIRKTVSAIFPDTTYFYESGGEPEHITDLTYESFVEFHRRYYHPSNAYIFLCGNIAAERTLEFLDERYLSAFDRIEIDSSVALQKLWSEPSRREIDAPASKEDDGKATVLVCWLLGQSTDPFAALVGTILSRYLLATESSPLRRALIDSKLGEDLADMSGYDTDLAQGIFAAGLRRTEARHADAIVDLVLGTLGREAQQGLDPDLIEGSIRRTEFNLREISDAGRYPYSLRLAERCYRSWIYGGDPLAHLKFERVLENIKGRHAADSAFFASIIRSMLLDSRHRLVSVVRASHELGRRLEKQTHDHVTRLTGGFGPNDIARFHHETRRLLEEQKTPPAPEALATVPKLDKKYLPAKSEEVPVERSRIGVTPAFTHPIFAGGISYLDVGFDCSAVPADLLQYLPLFCELSVRCGAAGMTYEEMSKRISLSTGGISCGLLLEEPVDGGKPVFVCFFHGKCLAGRFGEMTAILRDLFSLPALNDRKLLGDILLEIRNDLNSSVISSGHTFAAVHAASRLNTARQAAEMLDGVSQLRFLDRLVADNDIEGVEDAMRRLHTLVVSRKNALVSITADDPASHTEPLALLLDSLAEGPAATPQPLPFAPQAARATAIEIASSVNFVARAWRLGRQQPADLGLLYLLGINLSRGYLWDKVRVEGGAYGSWASITTTYPVFSCASYRDPGIGRTLDHFRGALESAAAGLDADSVDRSIIGTIGQIDRPRTPHAKGFSETCALLLGRTREYRQQVRDAVLGASPAGLKAKAQEILDAAETATTILGSTGSIEEAGKEGLELVREALRQDLPPTGEPS